MKVLNNAGIREIVYLYTYERIKTGGEAKEEENESLELANLRGIKIRKYDGPIFCEMDCSQPNAK
jgi:hypothetical protein